MKNLKKDAKPPAMGNVIKYFISINEQFQFIKSIHRPYDGKWSKTMVGYGPEDTHFVVELYDP